MTKEEEQKALEAVRTKEEKQKALEAVRQELLDRGDEMVSFRQLVERFDKIEEVYKGVPWNLEQIYSNFNVLIGKEPCDDAISRQAVLDIVNNPLNIRLDEIIKKLPPVTPAENPDINNVNIYRCSCGYGWDKSKVVRHHFCPNCGAKVAEGREE
jgi:adenine specific DNA methylase Mod